MPMGYASGATERFAALADKIVREKHKLLPGHHNLSAFNYRFNSCADGNGKQNVERNELRL